MTIAQNFASKFAVAFVAVAMIFSMFAPAVFAADESSEDLQKTINDLLAQVAALQAGMDDEDDTTTSGSCVSVPAPLTMGSQGANVTALQNRLIADGNAIAAGATGYFGAQTKMALAAWQAANGVAPAAGYYGPLTMAAMDADCTPADEDEDEDEDDSSSDELSGEGTLDTYEMEDASDDEVQEGAEDAEIAEITVEATDGDIEIDRMTFVINDGGVANSETDPWEVFDTLSLWVDGDMVAEFDAADEDAYLDEDTGEFRFSGIELVAMEDEEVEIIVGATVQSDVDSAGSATLADWVITGTDVRYFDADGVAEDDDTTDELPTASANFVIVEEGDGEELTFSLGDNNPDSTDIIVDEDDTTDGVTILEYTIEAEEGDIDLNDLFVNIKTSSALATIVDDVMLVIDGEEFEDDGVTVVTATSSRYSFDIDGDITVGEDEEVTVEVVVDLESQSGNYSNGATIMAQVTSTERDLTDAEGMDDLTVAKSSFSGSAVGDEHTLVAEGILVPVDGFTSEVDTLGTNDNIGEFTLEFEVTAVEGDFYITDNATTSTAAVDGIVYSVSGGAAVVTAAVTSSADEDTAGVFTINEGETETVTLTVTVDPTAAGTFRVQLGEVWYSANVNGTTGALQYLPTPLTDFRSAQKAINA